MSYLLLNRPPYNQRMLEISTAHVPERTAKLLDWQDPDVVECPVDEPNGVGTKEPLFNIITCTGWGGFGWIFIVSKYQVEAAIRSGEPELAALLDMAVKENFDYLKLDGDASTLPAELGFPTFDW